MRFDGLVDKHYITHYVIHTVSCRMESQLIGIACCAISAIFFGSMFVPVRNCNIGNGIFFQWVMSSAIILVGFIIYAKNNFLGFYPIAMLGGAFWTIGNSTAVPIIQRVGMAMGILIWNTTNCLSGWACGRFGLFGTKPHHPTNSILNYFGLTLVVVGGFVFTLVQNSKDEEKTVSIELQKSQKEDTLLKETAETAEQDYGSQYSSRERFVGVFLAIFAGFFYGITFVPVNYMTDNPHKFPSYPQDGLSYVFSHFSGIYITSSVLMLAYTAFAKNKPFISARLILPSFATGLMWAVAQCSFFVANQLLSQAITFPIITMLPGCIASLWSFFFFKEITGIKNVVTTSIGILITMLGVVIVAISK